MRIDERNLGNTAAADTTKTQETQRPGSGGSARDTGTGVSDRVQLSSVAGSLSAAVQSSSQERSQRVAELAAAYQSGSYVPDAFGTACGLITEALAGAGA